MKLVTRDGCQPRVLLVEDNQSNQLLGKMLLERLGCRTDVVQDGIEALGAVRRCRYDLVLMDILMPVMDGTEATRRLRAMGATIPILGLTATVDDRARLIGLGFTDCLSKPASAKTLRSAIAKALGCAASAAAGG
jgi:CheY-like chemotaxis protein